MENTFVVQRIRKTSRNSMILFGFLCIPILLLFVLTQNDFYNAIFGPFQLDQSQLGLITDIQKSKLHFVRISGIMKRDPDIENLSYTIRSRSGIRHHLANYIILQLGNYSLLARVKNFNISSESSSPITLTGELRPFSSYDKSLSSSLKTTIPVSSFLSSSPSNLLPFELETTEPYRFNMFAIGGFGLFLFGLFGFIFFNHLRFYVNPRKHPAFKILKTHGDPELLSLQIEKEANDIANTQIGPAIFTHSYFIWSSRFRFALLIYDDIVGIWLRFRSSKSRNDNARLRFYLKTGTALPVVIPSRYIDAAYSLFQQKVPWAFFSMNRDLEKRWKREKEAIISEAMERKNHFRL